MPDKEQRYRVIWEFLTQGNPEEIQRRLDELARQAQAASEATSQAARSQVQGARQAGEQLGQAAQASRAHAQATHEASQRTSQFARDLQAAGEAGYKFGMGMMWAGIPGTQFLATSGNLLQGTQWLIEGFQGLITQLSPLALGLATGTVAMAGLGAAMISTTRAADEFIRRIRDLSEVTGLTLGDTARMVNTFQALFGPEGAAAAVESIARLQAQTTPAGMMAQLFSAAQAARQGPGQVYQPAYGDVFARWGISIFEPGSTPTRPQPRSPEDVLFQVARDIATRQERDRQQAAIELEQLGPLVGGTDRLGLLVRRLREGAERGRSPEEVWQELRRQGAMGFVPSEQDIRRLDEFTMAQNRLALVFGTLKAEIGVGVLPVFTAFIEGLTEFLQIVLQGVRALNDFGRSLGLGPIVTEFARAVGMLLVPSLLVLAAVLVVQVLPAILSVTAAALPWLLIFLAIAAVLAAVLLGLQLLKQPFKDIGDHLGGFGARFKGVDWPSLSQVIKEWSGIVVSSFDYVVEVIDRFLQKIALLPENLVSVVQVLFAITIPETLARIWDWIVGETGPLRRTVAVFFTVTIPQALAAVWDWIVGQADTLRRTVTVFFAHTIPQALAAVWDWITGQADTLRRTVAVFFTVTMPQALAAVWDWIVGQAESLRRTVAVFFTVTMPQALAAVWDWIVGLTEPLIRNLLVRLGWVSDDQEMLDWLVKRKAITREVQVDVKSSGADWAQGLLKGAPAGGVPSPGGDTGIIGGGFPKPGQGRGGGILIPGIGILPMLLPILASPAPQPPGSGDRDNRDKRDIWDQISSVVAGAIASVLAATAPVAQAAEPEPGEAAQPTGDAEAMARAAAQRYGIPPGLFWALVQQESGGNPWAQSPAGAMGLTQLMPGTAASLGVDPWDPWQNLLGGARYLREQYERFGDWALALAAYNAGPGAVMQYGGIPPFEETQRYVEQIMRRTQESGETAEQTWGPQGQFPRSIQTTQQSLDALSTVAVAEYGASMAEAQEVSLLTAAAFATMARDADGQVVPSLQNTQVVLSLLTTVGFIAARNATREATIALAGLATMLPGLIAQTRAFSEALQSIPRRVEVHIVTYHEDVYGGQPGDSPQAPDDAGRNDPGDASSYQEPRPGLQAGGIVSRPTTIVAGEGGEPEAILPLSRLPEMLTQLPRPARVSGGNVYNLTMHVSGFDFSDPVSVQRVARVVGDQIVENLAILNGSGRLP